MFFFFSIYWELELREYKDHHHHHHDGHHLTDPVIVVVVAEAGEADEALM